MFACEVAHTRRARSAAGGLQDAQERGHDGGVELRAGVRRIVRHDHERWDGGGYPDGLAGEDIPAGARIVLVVDAWHAMTSDRPYRAAMAPEEARAELLAHAGTQFDPAVVSALLRVLEPALG